MTSGPNHLLWKWEIFAAAGTALYLTSIVLLLIEYNGKPIFDWYGVTLNAVISVFSTAAKASLMFAIAEAIGQWRWILFARQSRPLLDLNEVDSVSRGPLGSLRLLWPAKDM